MKVKQLAAGWKEVELKELLDYEQPTNYIVNSENYDNAYKTPVLTAGKSFILGYTEETEGIYKKLPVIIFDDFTTESKFVTFPFKVKSSAMKLLRPKNKLVSLKFIFLMMQKLRFNFSTHKSYYLSVYQNLKIPVPFTSEGEPDLKVQQKIVSILEKAEELKEKRKKSIEILDEYLKAVFSERFLKKKFAMVELGDKKLFDTQSGGTPSKNKKDYWENGTIPWIGSTACKDLVINQAEQFITEDGLKNSSAKLFPKNTLLVALVGATIGKTGILNFKCSTNQNIAGIIIKDKKRVNEVYLFFILQNLYNKFISLSSASFKMANLSFVRSLKIPFPPIELQEEFASIVKSVESMKDKQKHSKNQIDNLFNALMQKAFKGELKC
jgi:type I restriction enzyme S subunit